VTTLEPTSDLDRNQIVAAGRNVAGALRLTGAAEAAGVVDRLCELAYEDGGRESFYVYRAYVEDWAFALKQREQERR
jgi:hypothetical protein